MHKNERDERNDLLNYFYLRLLRATSKKKVGHKQVDKYCAHA